ncbi:DUF169 domain-containing protein [Methanobacterium congolense]|uniref:ArCR n=1 Tax=Methanobacterium congolense TaxID=118062 RepID=A0A1D3KZZ7_9EURY|nr:DUF169 domain-containing protein [Methanobacterium congolense]SCG84972.1 putative protein MJ0308 [Methanobacterium congolense]
MASCDVDGYKELSQKIKDKLGLEKSPVAVKLVLKEEDIPEGIPKIDETIRHCEMVQKAAQGATFYATVAEQKCKGGASAIGLMEAPEKVKTGEMYHSLKRFSSLGSAKRTMDAIPKIDPIMRAIAYAPLETTPFDPDVVVIIANPKQAMEMAQAMVYTLGGRVEADFAGIQSLCADAVAGPYTRKRPNITLGCSGSRGYADIKPDEVIVGMNGENIGCFVNALDAL